MFPTVYLTHLVVRHEKDPGEAEVRVEWNVRATGHEANGITPIFRGSGIGERVEVNQLVVPPLDVEWAILTLDCWEWDGEPRSPDSQLEKFANRSAVADLLGRPWTVVFKAAAGLWIGASNRRRRPDLLCHWSCLVRPDGIHTSQGGPFDTCAATGPVRKGRPSADLQLVAKVTR